MSTLTSMLLLLCILASLIFLIPTPDFTRTSQAVSYTYTMKIVFSIIKAKKVCYPPTTLTASRTIWMNLNQVYTSATDRLAKEELERDIINALYYHLISDKMRTALTN
jgi:hypothetical protein